MMSVLRGRVSKITFSNISNSLPRLYQSLSRSSPAVPSLTRFRSSSSIDGGRGEQFTNGGTSSPRKTQSTGPAAVAFGNGNVNGDDDGYPNHRYKEDRRVPQNPPDPMSNRPLRVDKPFYPSEHLSQRKFDLGGKEFDNDDDGGSGYGYKKSTATNQKNYNPTRIAGNKTSRPSGSNLFPFDEFGNDDAEGKMKKYSHTSPPQPFASEKQGDDFLEKFKLGFDKGEKPLPNPPTPHLCKEAKEIRGGQAVTKPPLPPPQCADEIFKKMKETGLIPNAVVMLDGLCKDGLVQEAMKLFGLMREKGTIPEVVIYTAVVEGFCKAQKFDDAKRIFRKMQNNGISPNAFSYTVLIQGLYKGKRLEDALDFCVEMLDAGHSPNLATFTGLVDEFCREKGVEEAQSTIETLRQRGFFFDEKAVKEYLGRKGPFLPLVWEAILGKKSSQKSF